MGQVEYWPESVEEMFDLILNPLKISYNELLSKERPWIMMKKDQKGSNKTGFGTFSGKIELLPDSLRRIGYDPLPVYGEPPRSPLRRPDMAAKYPLILITSGRVQRNTIFHVTDKFRF